MADSASSRKNILSKIKQALTRQVPVPFPDDAGTNIYFPPSTMEADVEFAKNFTDLLGKFSFVLSEKELAAQLTDLREIRSWKNIFCSDEVVKKHLADAGFSPLYTTDLANCDAAITGCEFLVARTGSILLSSAQAGGRTASVYAPIHICIAYTHQLVYDVQDALTRIQKSYKENLPSMITLASGPSRTADIEKTLVTGVHGPKEVFCFLVESSQNATV